MTHHLTRLLLLIALPLPLAALSSIAEGQRPERGRPSVRPSPTPLPSEPTMPPPLPSPVPPPEPSPVPSPLPAIDPRLPDGSAVVQPGIVRADRPLRTREPAYVQPGEAPGQLQVTATGPRSVSLVWQAPANATGYWIHQRGPGETTFYRGGSLVTDPTATVTGLLPATAYSFRVSAVYPQEVQRGEGMSDPVGATTAPAPAPTGLAASVVGRGRVTLSWDALTATDGIRLLRNGALIGEIKPVGASQGFLGQTGPGTLATSFADSVPVGTHQYQIQAVYTTSRPAAEIVSAPAPTPAVSVTIAPSGRVRFCQTRAGTPGCAEPGAPVVTIAAGPSRPQERRRSP